MNDVLFSSYGMDWETPQSLFDELDREFGFTLDPCCSIDTAKCKKFYTIIENGLIQDWCFDVVFMNPPYGRQISVWIKKAYDESLKGALVVCLVPARTDTSWWWNYCMKGEIRFLRGRLKFKGKNKKGEVVNNSATFPSAIVIFRGVVQ
jgi:site-specific DNA-methyltransferase (adenine-specific)